jgi:hypothetical protein
LLVHGSALRRLRERYKLAIFTNSDDNLIAPTVAGIGVQFMKARHELGLCGIWVNRRGETGNSGWLPYGEVSDLDGAAAFLLQP